MESKDVWISLLRLSHLAKLNLGSAMAYDWYRLQSHNNKTRNLYLHVHILTVSFKWDVMCTCTYTHSQFSQHWRCEREKNMNQLLICLQIKRHFQRCHCAHFGSQKCAPIHTHCTLLWKHTANSFERKFIQIRKIDAIFSIPKQCTLCLFSQRRKNFVLMDI